MPPVKAHALDRGLEIYQPASLRSARVQAELDALQPDVIVVAAYGKLLPPPVLNAPPGGCLGLHPSLLPRFRGPSPVASSILEGAPVTGVTLMLLDEGMDTGPIVGQREHPVSVQETAEALTFALFELGARLLLDNLAPWVAGRLTAQPQDNARATVTRKLERTDGLASWDVPALTLEHRRRAYTPWPGLFTHWEGKVLKLLDVVALPSLPVPEARPGEVVPVPADGAPVGVATSEGVLGLKTLQLEGRRALTAAEFLRGYPQFLGSKL
jgi:methionyl-tRNA formyltransferase